MRISNTKFKQKYSPSNVSRNFSLILFMVTVLLATPSYSTNQFNTHTFKAGAQLGDASVRSLLNKRLFWTGAIITNKGYMISYERLLYQYNNFFTISLGTGIANWGVNHDSVYLYRIYPNFKIWFTNKTRFGIYFNVGAGGPTILSKHFLKDRHLGGNFTFNDIIGIGVRLGKKEAIELAINFHHYSNASLMKPNPGFDVPAIFSIAYTM